MLTDRGAQQLLRAAAETVVVPRRQAQEIATQARRRTRQIRLAQAAAAAVVAVAGIGVAGWMAGVGLGSGTPPAGTPGTLQPPAHSQSTEQGLRVKMPQLGELTEGQARRRLEDRGLSASVSYTGAACREPGTVVSQSPDADSDVVPGATVTLVVADESSTACSTDAVVPWASLDPTYTDITEPGGRIDGFLETVNDPVPGKTLNFLVTLTAERDTRLVPCPDYSISVALSWDDQYEALYSLNCAAVPHRNAAGEPYLPAGVPVVFAMQWQLPNMGPEASKPTWVLGIPGGPELDVPTTSRGQ